MLEKHTRAHVLARIRAGVLEQGTIDVLRANGLSDRMDRTGQLHDGMRIVWAGRDSYFIDVARHSAARCSKAARSCSMFGGAGFGVRSCTSSFATSD